MKSRGRGFIRLLVLLGAALAVGVAVLVLAEFRFELSLDRLVFQHRLLPLLAGRLTVDRVRLEQPRAVLVETARAAPTVRAPATVAPTVALPIALHVVEAVIDDGRVEVRARGGAPIAVSGLGLRLRDLSLGPGGGNALERLSGNGDFRAEEIALPVTRAREVEGALRLTGGRLDAERLRFRTDEGHFQARWSADLKQLPLSYTLAVDGRPIDVNAMAGAVGKGGGFGPAHLTLEASGVGPEPPAKRHSESKADASSSSASGWRAMPWAWRPRDGAAWKARSS
jgi:hypothetical protein